MTSQDSAVPQLVSAEWLDAHRADARLPRFLEPHALRDAFEQLGASRAERVVCYCGSGINACQNLFALELGGIRGGLLYEGWWSDWCSVGTRAMAKGGEP
jgi:thiosulfate/3-mercaptopyruvate sulfurtransferase